MISEKYLKHLQNELTNIENDGLYKRERIITSQQSAEIVANGKTLLNFCANNYLGLSNHPEVMKASQDMIESHGYGMSSVRFICGTQDIHKELETKISEFLGTEDTILYAAAFDANGGVFEPLFTEEDCIISDELNHASIIDGVRLCKAARYRYKNNNMQDLEAQLIEASKQNHRFKIIVTDGVFSMDGIVADLKGVCDLAEKYDALVMVDDSHATGFIGKTGRGTHEANEVMGRVDIITSTLGKALGGALGGFTSGKKEIIDLLTGEANLRSKRELIEKFINENLVKIDNSENIEDEFIKFWDEEKVKAFNAIADEENLNKDELKKVVDTYIYEQREPLPNDIAKTLIETPKYLDRKTIVTRVLDKIVGFVDKFYES